MHALRWISIVLLAAGLALLIAMRRRFANAGSAAH
jgi:hypothetical protein